MANRTDNAQQLVAGIDVGKQALEVSVGGGAVRRFGNDGGVCRSLIMKVWGR